MATVPRYSYIISRYLLLFPPVLKQFLPLSYLSYLTVGTTLTVSPGNRSLDPIFALTIGVGAAYTRILREEREKVPFTNSKRQTTLLSNDGKETVTGLTLWRILNRRVKGVWEDFS